MKKKLYIFFLLFCIVLLTCACENKDSKDVSGEFFSDEQISNKNYIDIGVIVDTDYVNIRIEPSLDARIIDTALRGTVFRIIRTDIEDENGDKWVEVSCYGDTAFIFSDYVYEMLWAEEDPLTIATVKNADTPIYSQPEGGSILFYVGKYETLIVEQENLAASRYKVFDTTHVAYIDAINVSVTECNIEELLVQ